VLAGLLYLGAAVGLWIPGLGLVLLDGVAGAILMLFGLQRVTGLIGSLLLDLEAPLTVVVAALVFREHVGRYATAAVILIVSDAALMRVEPEQFAANPFRDRLAWRSVFGLGARQQSDPTCVVAQSVGFVRVKTLVAGTINLLLGLLVARGKLPALSCCRNGAWCRQLRRERCARCVYATPRRCCPRSRVLRLGTVYGRAGVDCDLR